MLSFFEMLQKFSERNAGKLRSLTEPLSSSFGIEYFHIHHVTNDGRLRMVCNDTRLNEYYFSKKESRFNPHMLAPAHMIDGYGFWDLIDAPGIQGLRKFYQKHLGMQSALTLVRSTSDGYYSCGFGIPYGVQPNIFLMGNNKYLLDEYVSFFIRESKDFFPDVNEDVIDLKDFMGDNFTRPLKSLKTQTGLQVDSFLEKIGVSPPDSFLITRREKQCLELISKGMTASEVAGVLYLSKRTVENYFASVKEKMGYRKKSEVIQHYIQMKRIGMI